MGTRGYITEDKNSSKESSALLPLAFLCAWVRCPKWRKVLSLPNAIVLIFSMYLLINFLKFMLMFLLFIFLFFLLWGTTHLNAYLGFVCHSNRDKKGTDTWWNSILENVCRSVSRRAQARPGKEEPVPRHVHIIQPLKVLNETESKEKVDLLLELEHPLLCPWTLVLKPSGLDWIRYCCHLWLSLLSSWAKAMPPDDVECPSVCCDYQW